MAVGLAMSILLSPVASDIASRMVRCIPYKWLRSEVKVVVAGLVLFLLIFSWLPWMALSQRIKKMRDRRTRKKGDMDELGLLVTFCMYHFNELLLIADIIKHYINSI
jgi:hypothetical protein